MSGWRLRCLALGAGLFPLFLLVHEAGHALVLAALGGRPVVVIRPWTMTFFHSSLPSVHIAGAAGLDLGRRLVFDAGGPLLAAALAARLALSTGGALRAALLASAAGQLFFAVLEPADAVFDAAGRPQDWLGWEEVDYGVPLLLLALAAVPGAGRLGARLASAR